MSSARLESLKILVPLLIAVLVVFFIPGLITGIIGMLLLFAFAFSLYFFRDPERTPPEDPALLVSSADGLVTHIETVENAPFDLGRAKRISVFLSVFDVHVNRFPCAGTVLQAVHVPGQFLDARAADCAARNERMDWLFQTAHGPIVVRQIAGLIARRIVGWAKPDDVVPSGFRLGMIRFGSRTDLFLPPDTEVLVEVGDRVEGGLTPVARWKGLPTAFEKTLSSVS